VGFFEKLAEVLLERVRTRAGQCNNIADGHASVFTRMIQEFRKWSLLLSAKIKVKKL
jgi:hypothetical protein